MQNLSQNLTLYVDGACRGNPGIGGWGVYIIDENQQEREFFGGELNTTNNRMELTAAIEGVLATNPNDILTIYTDSSYVQKGITEWITGWKKKNWKDVKNPDLWQKLDQACQGRNITWNWIKGHAGHAGNERADHLANLGADQATNSPIDQDKKKSSETLDETNDWLLDDPFGLDMAEEIEEDQFVEEIHSSRKDAIENENLDVAPIDHTDNPKENIEGTQHTSIHPAIKITPTTNPQQGERLLILDTETTGFYYQDTDRIIEVGAIEMINRRLTGSSIHIYINPKKPVGESENIHGISDEFLKDKPEFQTISQTLFEYLKGAEIVAHNATFDMNFLNMEFERSGLPALSKVCTVTDTLAIAKRKFPGQKNSLDALVKRLDIPPRDRTFHGALLDAEILADVYLAMTGGQVVLDIDQNNREDLQAMNSHQLSDIRVDIPVILPSDEEQQKHAQWTKKFQEKNKQPSLFEQYT